MGINIAKIIETTILLLSFKFLYLNCIIIKRVGIYKLNKILF